MSCKKSMAYPCEKQVKEFGMLDENSDFWEIYFDIDNKNWQVALNKEKKSVQSYKNKKEAL